MGTNQTEAMDIYGNKTYLNVPQKKLSAGSVKKFDGINDVYIPPQHKEDNIDRIVKEYGQGTGYAKWQKEHYKVNVKGNIPKEVLKVKTFDRDLSLEEANLSGARYRKVDFNYDRKMVMGC